MQKRLLFSFFLRGIIDAVLRERKEDKWTVWGLPWPAEVATQKISVQIYIIASKFLETFYIDWKAMRKSGNYLLVSLLACFLPPEFATQGSRPWIYERISAWLVGNWSPTLVSFFCAPSVVFFPSKLKELFLMVLLRKFPTQLSALNFERTATPFPFLIQREPIIISTLSQFSGVPIWKAVLDSLPIHNSPHT